jgi:hypothetical protein
LRGGIDWSHIFTHITYSAAQILLQLVTAYLKCNFAVWSSAASGVESIVLRLQLQSKGIMDGRNGHFIQAGSEGVDWIVLLQTDHVVRKYKTERKSKPLGTGLYGCVAV